MVARRLNKPIARVVGRPLFWLYEVVGSGWRCRLCNKEQPKGAVTFEVFVPIGQIPGTTPMSGKVRTGAKMYMCLECASKLLDEAKDRVDVCRKLGPEGYTMLDEM